MLKKRCSIQNQNKIGKLSSMSMEEALLYLTIHSELLSTPIIFSETKLLIGYNEIEIRQFIIRNKQHNYLW